jgi:hypothetical protein
MQADSVWDAYILEAMRPGAVTFGWNDNEVVTIDAPDKTLDTMQKAWEWIDVQMRRLEQERGRPRCIVFRLNNGQFRGLRIPEQKPGPLDDTDAM